MLWCLARSGSSSGHASTGKPGYALPPNPGISAKDTASSAADGAAASLQTALLASTSKLTALPSSSSASSSRSTRQPSITVFTCSTSVDPRRSLFRTSQRPLAAAECPWQSWACSLSRLQRPLNRDCALSSGMRMVADATRQVPSWDGQVPRKPRRSLRAKRCPRASSVASSEPCAPQRRLKASFRPPPVCIAATRTWSVLFTHATSLLPAPTKTPRPSGQSRPNPDDRSTWESGSWTRSCIASNHSASSALIPSGFGA
mmetsp:Transcript_75027/g.212031  ORF Transcript_75027/g.212031 Transcript_75027/m.212031 type:complete len:259 (+) Transcript_75027:2444-3220(+)